MSENEDSPLPFGKTPWDEMERPELLRTIQRFYSALTSSRSALCLTSHGETMGFWGNRGSGRKAIIKCEEALAPYEENSENIYRAFFRYANDLLFESPHVGFRFGVCLKCGCSYADVEPPRVPVSCESCGGKMRPLNWDDMKPAVSS